MVVAEISTMAAMFLSIRQFFFKLSLCIYFICWGILSVETKNAKDEESVIDSTKSIVSISYKVHCH